ncbi:AAA-ATPase [Cocos nucifera]|uniref:AAA-ATPase n=1 Tax=Cocos nucifera TaxID=13894 RepID=A0A8K0NA59_COCNU|nr:AAA-ATPase [Cocos nucifera]
MRRRWAQVASVACLILVIAGFGSHGFARDIGGKHGYAKRDEKRPPRESSAFGVVTVGLDQCKSKKMDLCGRSSRAKKNASLIDDDKRSYLSSRCLAAAPVVRLSKARHAPHPIASLPSSHTAVDSFEGAPLRWTSRAVERSSPTSNAFLLYAHHRSSSSAEHRSLELSFNRRHRHTVHSIYIPHILDEAARLRLKARERRLYTNRAAPGDDLHRLWSSVPFSHPFTFDTLALDPELKDDLRSDLLRFAARRDHYARVGRTWKRGYLLHGTPGTGKTSLVAAIANLLEFDVYDLELTAVPSNSHLRRLLVSTTPKSVVRGRPVVLNFVDGLWSSYVGERLMIFTTNHPERLDPALLRPGRMDRSIHLSYCGPSAFRVLARNYLDVADGHQLMPEVDALLQEVKITPADVAEVFMGCDGDGSDAAMGKVVEELLRRKAAMPSPPPPPPLDGGAPAGRRRRRGVGMASGVGLSHTEKSFRILGNG